MYARLTVIHVKEDRIDEAIKLYEESVVPEAKKQKGYQGAFLLTDRKTGDGISLTLWESEEDAGANEESLYYQEQLVKFIPLFKTLKPIREGYEVSVHSMPKEALSKRGRK